jgi:hypothetical protein
MESSGLVASRLQGYTLNAFAISWDRVMETERAAAKSVVRFSRTRNRSERQGLLVEEKALRRAERQCLADADARARARERAAERREELDDYYVVEFAARWAGLFPGCPEAERHTIAEHACRKYSGRIGRSAEAKQFEPEALELAARAHVRHRHGVRRTARRGPEPTRRSVFCAGGHRRGNRAMAAKPGLLSECRP